MLASMLPGVREVRAPLIAGYLWLLGLWIAFEPLVRGRHDGSELFATLGRLGDLMSPAVLGVVVSVAAYLVGSLADSGLQSLRRRIMRDYVMGSIASPDDGPSIKAVASLEIIGDEQIEEVRRRLGEAELDVSDLPDELFGDAETHFVDEADRSPERLGQELERSIMEELPLIATRLITVARALRNCRSSPRRSAASLRCRAVVACGAGCCHIPLVGLVVARAPSHGSAPPSSPPPIEGSQRRPHRRGSDRKGGAAGRRAFAAGRRSRDRIERKRIFPVGRGRTSRFKH